MKYRPEIDGIRAIALIPVILFHANENLLPHGYLGVDIFFVISGFLITTIIIEELEQDKFSIVKFYERRARRILPMLFVVTLVSIPFSWLLMLPSQLKDFANSILSVNFFVSNFYFWSLSSYFDQSNNLRPLLHTWSLSIEEQYYLFAPIVLMVFWKFGRYKLQLFWLVIFIVSLGLNHWAIVKHSNATFYLLPFRVWELSLGAIAAFILPQSNQLLSLRLATQAKNLLSLLGFVLIIIAYGFIDILPVGLRLYALPATIGVFLIILFGNNTIIGKLLSLKPFVFIGLISYSGYLWHQPIFAFYRLAYGEENLSSEYFLLMLSVLVLSYFSWRFIEQPFRNKNTFTRKKIFKISAYLTVTLILITFITIKTNGFSFRYPESDRELVVLDINVEGNYVKERFLKLEMVNFNEHSNKTKLLIIGDSYGEDLVNSIYEAHLDNVYDISTRHVNSRCGSLFVPFAYIRHLIDDSQQLFCESKSLMGDEKLKSLMLEADEIWFASAWRFWHMDYILESLSYVEKINNNIKVFGSKNFGIIDIPTLIKMTATERINQVNKVSESSFEVNQILNKILPPKMFINTQALLCGANNKSCRIFTDSGSLISFDGSHLTKSGAMYLGMQLDKSNVLND